MSSSCRGQGVTYTREDGERLRYFTKAECDSVGGDHRWVDASDGIAQGRGECLGLNGGPNYSLLCVDADPSLAPSIEGVPPGGPLDSLFALFGGSTQPDYSNLLLPAVGIGALIYLMRRR